MSWLLWFDLWFWMIHLASLSWFLTQRCHDLPAAVGLHWPSRPKWCSAQNINFMQCYLLLFPVTWKKPCFPCYRQKLQFYLILMQRILFSTCLQVINLASFTHKSENSSTTIQSIKSSFERVKGLRFPFLLQNRLDFHCFTFSLVNLRQHLSVLQH